MDDLDLIGEQLTLIPPTGDAPAGYDPDVAIHPPRMGMHSRPMTIKEEREVMSKLDSVVPPKDYDEMAPPPPPLDRKKRGVIGTDPITGTGPLAEEIIAQAKEIADLNILLHTFQADQGIYSIHYDAPIDVAVELDQVTSERGGDIQATLTIRQLTWGRERRLVGPIRGTISGPNGRASLVKSLDRAQPRLKNWADQIIEIACVKTIDAFREGEPAVLLRLAEKPESAGFLIEPMVYDRNPTIIFGDGGSGKSYIAMLLAASLSRGASMVNGLVVTSQKKVGYLDWEMSSWDHRGRLEFICGENMPDVVYVPCRMPIAQDVSRLRRIAREHSIDYWVVDSVAPACGGEPESAEIASNYFNALRSLGGGSLSVAHISKATGADQKPFGSSFWHNLARTTWFAKAVSWDDNMGITVTMRNRKNNLGRFLDPFTLHLDFAGSILDVRKGVASTETKDE